MSDDLSWGERWEGALCTQVGGDLWFPERGESTREAVAICNRCPFGPGPDGDNACLTFALEHETDGVNLDGVWGGLPPRARRKLRPAKQDATARSRAPKPCGTEAAAKRHRRRGEPVCDVCKQAATLARRERKGAA